MRPHLLFITRNYPPRVGGLETFSYHLIREFQEDGVALKIALRKAKPHLAWFLPYGLLRAIALCRRHSIRHVHLCDGLLAPIGVLLKRALGVRLSITVHGLDVTFSFPGYQRLIPGCLRRMDRIVCVSRATRAACLTRGVPAVKCEVIPNGIDPRAVAPPPDPGRLLREVERRCAFSLDGRRVLLTVGRLVPRKGVAWFVQNVMPRLPGEFVYLIAGDGPERERLDRLIRDAGMRGRAALLGRVTDALRNALLARADVCIMPNISVPGDMEGFGIAALEAGAAGVPVVASDLEGIRDAVLHGVTGYRVPEKDGAAFVDAILRLRLDRPSIREAVCATFGWPAVADRYRRFLFVCDSR